MVGRYPEHLKNHQLSFQGPGSGSYWGAQTVSNQFYLPTFSPPALTGKELWQSFTYTSEAGQFPFDSRTGYTADVLADGGYRTSPIPISIPISSLRQSAQTSPIGYAATRSAAASLSIPCPQFWTGSEKGP